MDIRDKISEGWIHCSIIIEILGRPPEYIDKVIKEVGEAIGKIKGIEVVNKEFHEPTEVKKLFSTFSETELLVKDLNILMELIFSYMPSSVEIIEPAELRFKLSELNNFINGLAGRLHEYDAVTKKLKIENMMLKKKLGELSGVKKEAEEKGQEEKEERKEE